MNRVSPQLRHTHLHKLYQTFPPFPSLFPSIYPRLCSSVHNDDILVVALHIPQIHGGSNRVCLLHADTLRSSRTQEHIHTLQHASLDIAIEQTLHNPAGRTHNGSLIHQGNQLKFAERHLVDQD
jgi:hypothetical protein